MTCGLTVPQASCWQQRGEVTGAQEAERVESGEGECQD